MASANLSSIKTLQKELKELKENPVEGFIVDLMSDENLFEWQVAIFGPPKTLYEGGYFKAVLNFPCDYPYSPPSMKFITKMFHPNIFENGDVCISILHTPGDDPQSGELPSERWNPTQNVRTILLSVISMLNEPNINSAAHVDASVSFRKWQESNGNEKSYECMVRHLVFLTKADAEKDKVKVPTTLEEYCGSGGTNNRSSELTDPCDYNDYFTPDYDDDDDDDDDDFEELYDDAETGENNSNS